MIIADGIHKRIANIYSGNAGYSVLLQSALGFLANGGGGKPF